MGRPLATSLWVATAVLAAAAVAGLAVVLYRQPAREGPRPQAAVTTPPAAPAATTDSGIAPALEVLLTTTWTPRIFVDLSKEMDRPVRLAPAPEELVRLLGAAPYASTPRRFAARFVELFDEAARRRPKVVALGPGRPTVDPRLLETVEPLELRQLMEPPQSVLWVEGAPRLVAERRRLLDAIWEGPTLLVVIVGSPEMRGAAENLGFRSDDSRSVVLVIDLSADGGGTEIARAFDVPPYRVAAYWNPLVAAP